MHTTTRRTHISILSILLDTQLHSVTTERHVLVLRLLQSSLESHLFYFKETSSLIIKRAGSRTYPDLLMRAIFRSHITSFIDGERESQIFEQRSSIISLQNQRSGKFHHVQQHLLVLREGRLHPLRADRPGSGIIRRPSINTTNTR